MLDFKDAKPEEFTVISSDEPASQPDTDSGSDDAGQQDDAPADGPETGSQGGNQAATSSQSTAPVATGNQADTAPADSQTTDPFATLKPEDVVSRMDRKDLLKALGFDDYFQGVADHYQATGGFDDYLAVKSVDFKTMTPEQLMRYDVAKRYKGLSPEAIDLQVNRMLQTQYGITPDLDEDQAAPAKEILAFDMEAKRKEFIDEQAKFKAPERQAPQPVDVETVKKDLLAQPAVGKFVSEKKLVFGPQDSPVNFMAEPDQVLPLLYDGNAYNRAIAEVDKNGAPTGKIDYQKAVRFAAYMANYEAIEKTIYDSGVSAGRKQVRSTLENPGDNTDLGTNPEQEKSVFDAFAKRGVHRNGV